MGSEYDATKAQRGAQHTEGVCPDCGTPTTTYRGTLHKWRCLACVADVVGVEFRPADARPHDVLPGCDTHGRPIMPMGRHRSPFMLNTETKR